MYTIQDEFERIQNERKEFTRKRKRDLLALQKRIKEMGGISPASENGYTKLRVEEELALI